MILTLLGAILRGNGQEKITTVHETEFSIGKSLTLYSPLLGEERVLNIYLPLSYSIDSQGSYPVIYLLDGSRNEDFIHISGIVQFVSFPWIEGVPESIVVGIGNVDRKRDFTYPALSERDPIQFPTSGKSREFINFLETELQPFIDSSFRTEATKTIIGQSIGGLLATEILLKKPELFDNYIIVSPSLWWDNESLLRVETNSKFTNKSIFIAVGKEGKVMESSAKKLYKKLKKVDDATTNVVFKYLKERTHGDVLHLAVYCAFEELFND